jgi:hypothetical protein
LFCGSCNFLRASLSDMQPLLLAFPTFCSVVRSCRLGDLSDPAGKSCAAATTVLSDCMTHAKFDERRNARKIRDLDL